jgi:hypothetical protein
MYRRRLACLKGCLILWKSARQLALNMGDRSESDESSPTRSELAKQVNYSGPISHRLIATTLRLLSHSPSRVIQKCDCARLRPRTPDGDSGGAPFDHVSAYEAPQDWAS